MCFWTDDGRTSLDVAVHDGPNGELTLREARLNYAVYHACHPRYSAVVRPPRENERVYRPAPHPDEVGRLSH